MIPNDVIWETASRRNEHERSKAVQRKVKSEDLPVSKIKPATALHILLLLEWVLTPNRIATSETAANPMAISSRYPAVTHAAQNALFSFSHPSFTLFGKGRHSYFLYVIVPLSGEEPGSSVMVSSQRWVKPYVTLILV